MLYEGECYRKIEPMIKECAIYKVALPENETVKNRRAIISIILSEIVTCKEVVNNKYIDFDTKISRYRNSKLNVKCELDCKVRDKPKIR